MPATVAARDPATLRLVPVNDLVLSLNAATLGPGVWTFCLSVSRKIFAASLPEDLTAATPSEWSCVDVTIENDYWLYVSSI